MQHAGYPGLSWKFGEPTSKTNSREKNVQCLLELAGIELSLELMKVGGGGKDKEEEEEEGEEKVFLETTHDSIWTFNIDNWHSMVETSLTRAIGSSNTTSH